MFTNGGIQVSGFQGFKSFQGCCRTEPDAPARCFPAKRRYVALNETLKPARQCAETLKRPETLKWYFVFTARHTEAVNYKP